MKRDEMINALRKRGVHRLTVLEALMDEQLAEVLEAFKVEEGSRE